MDNYRHSFTKVKKGNTPDPGLVNLSPGKIRKIEPALYLDQQREIIRFWPPDSGSNKIEQEPFRNLAFSVYLNRFGPSGSDFWLI